MTEKDIVRLAEEAELWLHTDRKYEAVEKFAKLVAAAEREACVRVAESYEPRCDTCPSGVSNAIRQKQEPVRLQCVICGTVYADGVPPQVAQPEQEPVAWISHNAGLYHGKPDESLNPLQLYTAPPQREWQGLTEEEIIRLRHLYDPTAHWSLDMFARAIEAKLKEKNAND